MTSLADFLLKKRKHRVIHKVVCDLLNQFFFFFFQIKSSALSFCRYRSVMRNILRQKFTVRKNLYYLQSRLKDLLVDKSIMLASLSFFPHAAKLIMC